MSVLCLLNFKCVRVHQVQANLQNKTQGKGIHEAKTKYIYI